MPPRPWAKVVAAVQGVVLTVAAAGVLPRDRLTVAALVAAALVLLASRSATRCCGCGGHRTAPVRVPVGAAP